MENSFNEGQLRRTIVYTVFYCRLLIVCCLIFFYGNNWLQDKSEFMLLLFSLLPMTVLYLVLVLKYVITRRRYFIAGEPVSKSAVMLNCPLLILLHLIELLLIWFRNRVYGDVGIEWLYGSVAVAECILAGYAGIYLSGLFSNRANAGDQGGGE